MDPKLLLVKIMTLLYKESVSSDKSIRSNEIVNNVIETIKLPETGLDFGGARESLQALRATAAWMATAPAGHLFDKNALLQRVRINAGDDEYVYQAFETGISDVVDGEELQAAIIAGRMELRGYLSETKFKDYVKKLYQSTVYNNMVLDTRQVAREAMAQLEEYAAHSDGVKVAGLLGDFDVTDVDKTCELFEQAGRETSANGILRMGWQGLNRMTGDHGGLRRGEFIVLGALQHNFKTGATMNMLKHAALYNDPKLSMRDPTKKPLLVHISTENDLHINIMWLYANLWENEHGTECDLSAFKDPNFEVREAAIKRATQYVMQKLTATGYTVKFYRFDPSDTTFYSITDLLNNLQAQGFEIHMCVLDYLNMCSKAGCLSMGPTGSDVRDLYRRMRNYTAPRGITFVTPHQLSTEAKALVRMGVENFVGEIANKGYYDGCKTVDQEVDMEIYIHIEKVNGKSYLTFQRGKHRKAGKITPEKDLYFVMEFHECGGIRDDINGRDTSRRSLRGGGDGGNAWWATNASEAAGDSGLPVA